MEYCSSVLCLHPIRQSLYMGLMGCTACGGISYPPCTNGLHDVKNTLENAWLNTDNSQTFGLYVHYRGLKRHPQIKCSLQGNKNIEGTPRKKVISRLQEIISTFYILFSDYFHFFANLTWYTKKSFPTDWKIELQSNSEVAQNWQRLFVEHITKKSR